MSIQAKILSVIMRYQMADFYKDRSAKTQRAKMEKFARVVRLPDNVRCEPAIDCPVSAEWITTQEIGTDR